MIHMVDFLVELTFAVFLVGLVCIWPVGRIFRRAGLSPWHSAWLLLPVLGFWVAGAILAFKDWPNVAEVQVEETSS